MSDDVRRSIRESWLKRMVGLEPERRQKANAAFQTEQGSVVTVRPSSTMAESGAEACATTLATRPRKEPSRSTVRNIDNDSTESDTQSSTETESETPSDPEVNAKAANQAKKRRAERSLSRESEPRARTRQKMMPGSTTSQSASAQPPMAFPNGALRITRTAGRANAKNCINLSDIIYAKHLKSACVYSFFIAESELFPHLPFSKTSNGVPIYIGRDPNLDPMTMLASQEAGIPFKEKVTRKDLGIIRGNLQRLHGNASGRKNLHTFYAWCPGSAHTKALLLVYSSFLRIVITSCNMMDIDTELGDNHWYIHDVPKLARPLRSSPTGFEADLLSHMEALGAPEEFLSSVRGEYDYSSVKVHLITSVPGTHSGVKAEHHGLLRLRRVMRNLNLDVGKKYSSADLGLEVCAASIGNLTPKWLNSFYDCLRGSENLDGHATEVPEMKIFFPTTEDVQSASIQAQQGASNIGCHMRPWKDASIAIKRLFRRYQSKDKGCLFHQKFILAYNARNPDQEPYFVYIGSANLSQSAWGALEHDRRGNEATSDMKLVKMSNFECGVLIPGDMINSLLEDGTKTWQEGIVPHIQTTTPYNLSKDKAWNSPEWVAGYRESQNR